MTPTQERLGCYWRTDDAADLFFNESGRAQPQTIRCYNMSDLLNRGEARDVPVASLEFLAAGLFGEGRPCCFDSTVKWTGAAYRYGIYRNPMGLHRDGIVLLEGHGGGLFGYAFDDTTSGETWTALIKTCSRELLWNICHQIAETYRAARAAEGALFRRAIAEKRIVVSRRGGRATVSVLHEQEQASQVALR
jgi:hypothetical protein